MDEQRKIRWLIPPFLFLGSLVWGIASGGVSMPKLPQPLLSLFQSTTQPANGGHWGPENVIAILGLVAAGGGFLLASGYVFTTITICLLQAFFYIRAWILELGSGPPRSRNHEVELSKEARDALCRGFALPDSVLTESDLRHSRKYELSAGATFDHQFLGKNRKRINQWLVRRWNGFHVNATSTCALLLSILAGCALNGWRFGAAKCWWWWFLPGALAGLCLLTAIRAWRSTMMMIEFQLAIYMPAKYWPRRLTSQDADEERPGARQPPVPPNGLSATLDEIEGVLADAKTGIRLILLAAALSAIVGAGVFVHRLIGLVGN